MRENAAKNNEKLIETEAEVRFNKKLIAEKAKMLSEAKAIQASLKKVLDNVDAVEAEKRQTDLILFAQDEEMKETIRESL